MIIKETVEGARDRLKSAKLEWQTDLYEMKYAIDDVRDEYNRLPYGLAPFEWQVKKLKEMVDWLYDVTRRFHRDYEGHEFLYKMFCEEGMTKDISDLAPRNADWELEEFKDFEYWHDRAVETYDKSQSAIKLHRKWKGGAE